MKIETPIRLSDLKSDQIRELQALLSQLDLYPLSEIDGVYGSKTQKAWGIFKQTHYLGDLDLIGSASYEKLVAESQKETILLTRFHFDKIYRYARSRDRDSYFLPINKALKEFEINNLKRITAFLAQVSHESGNLRYSEEIASGFAYEGRRDLGNTVKGDGTRYKGRGLMQLTGRANYRHVGKVLGVDLEVNPALAATPLLAARIAGYYWQSHGLNQLADSGDFKAITRRINGGYNGLEDRLKRLAWAKEVLGC